VYRNRRRSRDARGKRGPVRICRLVYYQLHERWEEHDDGDSHVARIDRDVWFFLIEARVIGTGARALKAGSRTLVQCFVPGRRMEDCLAELDAFLPGAQLQRIDIHRASRFNADGEDEDYPGDFFRRPLEQAASRNQCTLGVFITSDEVSPPPADVH
jgi:hypothetical protein